ncbi:uncharacterized protein si:dkeyp-117h8.4 isoform X2 [Pleuronectes platessa]|uniref:uncharacterized protein si:dkeyp-117h8.4 isoform X2 n=1 Tax=Pleuronectes platessa TaxID=8262 RepID=UPI00232A670A|nr:uncharacterized protein si:dkeyp-117h8.4 isoform X2 [Pleuronectes platessa]
MNAVLKKGLHENSLLFKRSLDRIVDKYSKLQHLDGGMEVDLANTQQRTLARYMKLSIQELSDLESKSLTDLSDTREDSTGNSQLEFTLQDDGADDSSASSSQYSEDGDGMAQSNRTELIIGSSDESEQYFSETELQPEDQDEELEVSLTCHGNSFVELLPGMISRIETARQRQNLSNAADSVLRRYHRWRQQSAKGNLNNTVRHRNPGKKTSGVQLRETSYSPERRQFMTTQSAPRSPLQFSTSRLAWQADQPSPGRERGPMRREQHHSVCARDLSRHFNTSKPKEVSLNPTYSMPGQLGERPCSYAGSPSRPCYPTANPSLDLSLRSKRLSQSAHSEQAPGCSTFASEVSFAERSDIYSSPVRQSPIKSQMPGQLGERPCSYAGSPSRPCYPTANPSLDLSLRSKRLSQSAHSEQAPGCSTFASEVSFAERSDIYSSPVRQSPIKSQMSVQLGERPCTYAGSPSRPCYPTANPSLDLSLRSKRLSQSAHSEQAPGCSTFASEVSFAERSDIYSSPVRQSPIKSQMSVQLGERPCTYAGSPSWPCYPTANPSLDLSLRSKRLSQSARSEQAHGCSTFASEVSFAERSDIYSSPVRQSPIKSRLINSLSRSPYVFSRSPRDNSEESFSRKLMRRRSMSPSLSSPPHKPIVPQRMPYPQDSRPSLQPQLHSPQSATADRPRLRRHLSLDSSLPSIGASYSKKEIDEELLRLYHKFVCLNKSSFFNSHPCRICVRCPQASRANSSSALAALALSPHRSILRKRNRKLAMGDHPLPKRSREEGYTSSPGSKRHGNEMLRRRLSQSELSRDDLFYSSSKHSMRNKFSTQQPTADAHQEAGMRQRRPVSAEFYGLCGFPESSLAYGSSPRK